MPENRNLRNLPESTGIYDEVNPVQRDDEYGDDKTPIVHRDTADSTSCDPSDVSLDGVSLATTSSTLPASGGEETLSRGSTNRVRASSLGANDVTVVSSRRDLSFVCRADNEGAGPPWLPANEGTLLQGDGLPSLQYGASSLLALVYDRQSQSCATADHAAVQYTARSTSASFSRCSSSSATEAVVASSVEVNVENMNIHQTDRAPVLSETILENHRIRLSSDSVVGLYPSQLSQLNTTSNSARGPSVSSGGCMDDVTAATGVVEGVAPPRVSDVDEQRREAAYDIVDEPSVSTSTAALHVHDYLLSDLVRPQHGLMNGWTNNDNDEDRDLGLNDVERNVTTADASRVPETLRHVSQVRDAKYQTPDKSSLINDTAHEITQISAALDETDSASVRCNGACHEVDDCSVCVNGHLQSTTGDEADDPCRVCRNCDDPSSCVRSDVNSNVTPSTSAICTSGNDGELDETESRDVERCQRVAEQLSAAWSSTVRPAEVLDIYNHVDDDLLHSTLPTPTTRPIHSIFDDAEDFLDSDEWMEDELVLTSHAAASSHDGLKSPPPYSLQSTLTDFDMTADGIIQPAVTRASYEVSSPSAVPRSRDVIQSLVSAAVDVFWQCRRYGESWDEVSPPQSYLTAAADCSDDEADVCAQSRRIHRRLVFDLVAEILQDIYSDDDTSTTHAADTSTTQHDGRWPRRRPPPRRPRRFAVVQPAPTTVDRVKPLVERHVFTCLGLDSTAAWTATSRKRGVDRRMRDDAVDRMLVEELCLEEPGWVDYDDDVTTRKLQLSSWLQEALIADTIYAVDNALCRRQQALASLNGLV